MAEYPQRDKYFAHKLVRLMIRTCAAQEIGSNAFLVVVAIAHTEDAKRYTAPVTFWNEQLESVLGFSRGKLDRARKRAVEAGWLHYERDRKRSVGKYWCLVPECYLDVPDGTADEDFLRQPADDPTQNEAGPNPKEGALSSASGRKADDKRTIRGRSVDDKRTIRGRSVDDKRATFVPAPNNSPTPSPSTGNGDEVGDLQMGGTRTTGPEEGERLEIAQRISKVVPVNGSKENVSLVAKVAHLCVAGEISRADVENAIEAVRCSDAQKPGGYFHRCLNNSLGGGEALNRLLSRVRL